MIIFIVMMISILAVVIAWMMLSYNKGKIPADVKDPESILKNTGTAWYYLLDLDSRTFVLPQTNGYMKYGNSNQFIKQSLPNIKGQTGWTQPKGDDPTTPPYSKLFTPTYA